MSSNKDRLYRYLTFGVPVGFGCASVFLLLWIVVMNHNYSVAAIAYSLLPVAFGVVVAVITRVVAGNHRSSDQN